MKLNEDSKQAFAALTARYIDLVYSAALRQVQDQHLAEDVTQAVFIVLARKMSSLHHDRPLGPWLLQTTKYVASNARRSQFKRQLHERRASEMAQHIDNDRSRDSSPPSEWQELSPLLDQGINRLPGKYREALVLRYFETMSLQEVGRALGISEAAAAKRVSRAVEKLRNFFQGQGVSVSSSAALSGLLSAHLTQSAPSGLASAVGSSAEQFASAGAGAAALAKGAILMAATEKLKIAVVVTAILSLGIGGALIVTTSLSMKAAPTNAQTAARELAPGEIPFTNGTIRILGMSDDPINPDRWWLADGSRLDRSPPGYLWLPEHTRQDEKSRLLHFIVSLSSTGLVDPAIEVDLGGGSSTGNMRYGGNRSNLRFGLRADVPTNLPVTDATFRIASGAWQAHAEYDLATQKLSPHFPEITIKSVTESPDRTLVALRFTNPPGPKLDWLITIITNDDKRIGWSERQTIGADGDQIWKFRCRLDDVKQVVYESRPFEERRLNRLSIDPIAQTKPVVQADVLPGMTTSNTAP